MVPVSRYWVKLRRGYFRFPISGQSLIKKKSKNFTIPEPVMIWTWNLDQYLNLTRETNLKKIWRWRHVRKLWRHWFFANLEQFGGQIPDTESAKTMFLVMVTFCLIETENRTKKSLTQLSHCFEWRYFFGQKTLFFCWKKNKKNGDIGKIKGA